jgi:DNA-binding PadR family transcriptional regulator
MNLSRLMVLGLLAHGPRHGHQIRRDAEQTNVGNWGGVSVGALYRELRQMEGEDLVEPLRTEQVGRRPARTVYRITDEGQRELRILRERAIRDLHHGPDAFGVALVFGRTWDRAELVGLLLARRQAIAAALEGVKAECTQLEARGAIGPLDVAMFRRRAMQLEAELRWHDEFERVLPTLPEPPRRADEVIADVASAPEDSSPPTMPKRGSRKPKPGGAPRGGGNRKRSEGGGPE